MDFHVALNLDAHSTSRFKKAMRRNLVAPMANLKNKWERTKLKDIYYVVRVTAIPYPRFGVLINIISKEDIAYRATIGEIPFCICTNFTKMSSQPLGMKWIWVYCKHLHYVFRF